MRLPDRHLTEETFDKSHTLPIAIAINKVEAALAVIDRSSEGIF